MNVYKLIKIEQQKGCKLRIDMSSPSTYVSSVLPHVLAISAGHNFLVYAGVPPPFAISYSRIVNTQCGPYAIYDLSIMLIAMK